MHVEDCAVFDETFNMVNFKAHISDMRNDPAAENLEQLATVAAICNAANFMEPHGEKPVPASLRKVSGDATGKPSVME